MLSSTLEQISEVKQTEGGLESSFTVLMQYVRLKCKQKPKCKQGPKCKQIVQTKCEGRNANSCWDTCAYNCTCVIQMHIQWTLVWCIQIQLVHTNVRNFLLLNYFGTLTQFKMYFTVFIRMLTVLV